MKRVANGECLIPSRNDATSQLTQNPESFTLPGFVLFLKEWQRLIPHAGMRSFPNPHVRLLAAAGLLMRPNPHIAYAG